MKFYITNQQTITCESNITFASSITRINAYTNIVSWIKFKGRLVGCVYSYRSVTQEMFYGTILRKNTSFTELGFTSSVDSTKNHAKEFLTRPSYGDECNSIDIINYLETWM